MALLGLYCILYVSFQTTKCSLFCLTVVQILHLQREHWIIYESVAQKPWQVCFSSSTCAEVSLTMLQVPCFRHKHIPYSHKCSDDSDHFVLRVDERRTSGPSTDRVFLATCVLLRGGQFSYLGWSALWFKMGFILFDWVCDCKTQSFPQTVADESTKLALLKAPVPYF